MEQQVAAVRQALCATKIIKEDNVPCKIEEGLYLGSLGAANDKTRLKSLNITHILTVANALAPAHPNDFTYKVITVLDQEDVEISLYFDECFKFIEEGKRVGGVFVHCYMGRSRSVTAVVSYVMKKHGMGMSEALKLVKSKRQLACPNAGFMLQLQNYEKSLRGISNSSDPPSRAVLPVPSVRCADTTIPARSSSHTIQPGMASRHDLLKGKFYRLTRSRIARPSAPQRPPMVVPHDKGKIPVDGPSNPQAFACPLPRVAARAVETETLRKRARAEPIEEGSLAPEPESRPLTLTVTGWEDSTMCGQCFNFNPLEWGNKVIFPLDQQHMQTIDDDDLYRTVVVRSIRRLLPSQMVIGVFKRNPKR